MKQRLSATTRSNNTLTDDVTGPEQGVPKGGRVLISFLVVLHENCTVLATSTYVNISSCEVFHKTDKYMRK